MALCLASCGGNPRAPVEDRNRPADTSRPMVLNSRVAAAPGEYYVKRGDTLYSIAWRQGFDFRALAAANGIPAPYTIYPGQKLRLREAPVPPRASSTRASSRTSAPDKPSSTAAPGAGGTGAATGATGAAAGVTGAAAGVTGASAGVTKGSSNSGKTGGSAPAQASPAPAKPRAPTGAVSRWQWPAEGQVIRQFSATVHKGIDISGNRGEPVRAVADGLVVYAGTGIVGFGELLIVKHNDTYLSAYGHNDRLLVREGASVSAGQEIAEKGSSGTDTVKLHFEIRREGKPIDPLRLLPRR